MTALLQEPISSLVILIYLIPNNYFLEWLKFWRSPAIFRQCKLQWSAKTLNETKLYDPSLHLNIYWGKAHHFSCCCPQMPTKAAYRREGLFCTVQGLSPLRQGKHQWWELEEADHIHPQSGSRDAGVYGTTLIPQVGSFLLRQPNLETLQRHGQRIWLLGVSRTCHVDSR